MTEQIKPGLVTPPGYDAVPKDRHGRPFIRVQNAQGSTEFIPAPMTAGDVTALRDAELVNAQRQVFVLNAMDATGDSQAVTLMKAWQEYVVVLAGTRHGQTAVSWPERPREVI